MGTKYSTILVGGDVPDFESLTIADDGSEVESNRVKYATIQTDLARPLHEGIKDMDAKLLNQTNEGPDTQGGPVTLTTADHNTVQECTGTFTLSLPNPSGNAGFQCTVKNAGSGTITVDVSGGANIDGGSSVALTAGQAIKAYVNNAGTAYYTVTGTKGAGDGFASGTVMIFEQNAAPTGWTKKTDAAYNNTAMRISTGTVSDVTNGSVDFDTVFGITATDDHTLTGAESGTSAHTHPIPDNWGILTSWTGGTSFTRTAFATDIQTNTGNIGAYTEEISGYDVINAPTATSNSTEGSASSGHSHNIDLQVRYRDVIVAEKA